MNNRRNPFLVAIEDEMVKILETDVKLPRCFTVVLPDSDFMEIIRCGVHTKKGVLPNSSLLFVFSVASHSVVIKSELAIAPTMIH